MLATLTALFFAAGNRRARQVNVAAERLQLDAGAALAKREVEALAAAARVLALGQLHREVGPEITLGGAHEDRGVVGAAEADTNVAVVRAELVDAVVAKSCR